MEEIDRAAALRRSGLIFLGGFAASAFDESPALADNRYQDNPPIGMGISGGGRLAAKADAPAAPASKLPSHLRDYRPASYVAIIMKRYDDTVVGHGGLPNTNDLANLNIPIPPGLHRLASYRIPYSALPHIAGLDETAVKANANHPDGAYHGRHPYKPGDSTDDGTPVVGSKDEESYYDIWVLVYGKRKWDPSDAPSDDDE